MQKKSSVKSFLILGGIIALGVLAYLYFSGTPQDATGGLDATGAQTSDATVEANKILVLLNQTTALHIDPALFKTPVYMSLVDHTVPVIEQPVGKANPFFYVPTAPKK